MSASTPTDCYRSSRLPVSFAIADHLTTGDPILYFLFLRVACVALAWATWLILRGRARYGLRFSFTLASYIGFVDFILMKYNLVLTPYFAGLCLVMVTATIAFPMRYSVASVVYILANLPVPIWVYFHPPGNTTPTLLAIVMSIGTTMMCVMNSGLSNRELRERLAAKEALARDLGKREKEIREKAQELLKRQTFESQFSPQVVASVLSEGSAALDMQQRNVAVAVIDVEASTKRIKELDPQTYKDVIEEVFDVFSSACLCWNVTVDKFTGDGAQAFAGAPTSSENDMQRAIMACRDTLRMLEARGEALTRRWGSPLRVRCAVVEGPALVGFIGRGTLKSYTAIGETVSFTHRLCAASEPGKIACFSMVDPKYFEGPHGEMTAEVRAIGSLKGFEDTRFTVAFLTVRGECGTPMVGDLCPGCQARDKRAA